MLPMVQKKMTPEEEDRMIEAAFKELLDGYLASNHRKKVEIIERAYKFAKEAHKGIRRRSGEPYILHPIAEILAAVAGNSDDASAREALFKPGEA